MPGWRTVGRLKIHQHASNTRPARPGLRDGTHGAKTSLRGVGVVLVRHVLRQALAAGQGLALGVPPPGPRCPPPTQLGGLPNEPVAERPLCCPSLRSSGKTVNTAQSPSLCWGVRLVFGVESNGFRKSPVEAPIHPESCDPELSFLPCEDGNIGNKTTSNTQKISNLQPWQC